MTAPNPSPKPAKRVRLNVKVSASYECENGTEVAINEKAVILHRPGPRGGEGTRLEIPLDEWDAIADGVEEVRAKVQDARLVLESPK
jgi:hypothetical protein